MEEIKADSLISDDDIQRIILMACSSGPVGEDKLMKVLEWCSQAKADALLVDMVTQGKLVPICGKKGIRFGKPDSKTKEAFEELNRTLEDKVSR